MNPINILRLDNYEIFPTERKNLNPDNCNDPNVCVFLFCFQSTSCFLTALSVSLITDHKLFYSTNISASGGRLAKVLI